MRHVPFFRWVAALGLVLIGAAVVLYWTAPDSSDDLKQVDLAVITEQPGGACTVRWTDPFDGGRRQGPYTCDVDRAQILKAPGYDPATGYGWDTGFVIGSGSHKGDLYALNEDGDDGGDTQLTVSDGLVTGGILLTVVGVVGGNIRSLVRMTGVNPDIVRRARRLREAAALVAQDHRLALDAVRDAWAPRQDITDPALLAALRVLVDAGPRAHKVAQAGAELTARLDPLLAAAAPAAGRRQMLAASSEERLSAKAAVTHLRTILAESETRALPQQFAQTSVDLLRAPDIDPADLTVTVDFESRTAEYHRALADVVGTALPAAEHAPQP